MRVRLIIFVDEKEKEIFEGQDEGKKWVLNVLKMGVLYLRHISVCIPRKQATLVNNSDIRVTNTI